MAEAPISSSIEAEFARRLAGNEKRNRDKALKKLKQFLNLRSAKTDGGFSRVEMLSLWKGLFYCMWMSDKPLVQEELAETISNLLVSVSNTKTAMLFFDTFLETMQREWRGIDRLRMDKFYFLVRCMLRNGFEFLKQQEWNEGIIDWMLAILKNGPISFSKPVMGMQYHLSDIYLDELAKVSKDTLDAKTLMTLLDPYCVLITATTNYDLVRAITENVFQELIENSKPALELLAEEEYLINVKGHTQTESVDSNPVAKLNVDYVMIAERLFELASNDKVLGRNRKQVFKLVEKFRELGEGRLPVSDMPDAEYSSEDEIEGLEKSLTKKIVAENDDDVKTRQEYQKTRKRKMKVQANLELDVLPDIDLNNNDDSGLADVMEQNGDGNQKSKEKLSKKISKKKKRILKNTTNSIISGSAIKKTPTENDSNSSEHNNKNDNTILKLSTQKTKPKKKKKNPKATTDSVILGSAIKETLIDNDSNSSENANDNTILELSTQKVKPKKKKRNPKTITDSVIMGSAIKATPIENDSQSSEPNTDNTILEVSTVKVNSKKKKGNPKTLTDSVIIGSAIKAIPIENDSQSSEPDTDTNTNKTKSKKKVKKVVLSSSLRSEDIPDLLQDIVECKEAAKKILKRKQRAESQKLLREWLGSGNESKEKLIKYVKIKSDEPKKSIDATKISKKKGKGKLNADSEVTAAESVVSEIMEQSVEVPSKKQKKKHKKEPAQDTTIHTEIDNLVKRSKKKNQSNQSTDQEKFAKISTNTSMPAVSTFFKVAATKVDTANKNKHLAATKRKLDTPLAVHSPKRVVFEMSKTRIQPFRKMDKSSACSPSPNSVAFDPRKTPDFGLLKRKSGQQKKRKSASDFF